MTNAAVSSASESPNTDGIHLQNSVSVSIRNATLGCGDDCISIQTGCSDVAIRKLNCGPGHGVSTGGRGKGNTLANFVATRTGVRITTWQGMSGYVKGVNFTCVKVSQVMAPIVIDQFYCDHARCKNQTSAVAMPDVTYDGVRGNVHGRFGKRQYFQTFEATSLLAISSQVPTLAQAGASALPTDKVVILGDGNTKGIFMNEDDIGTYTIKAVDDPRTLNKVLYIRAPANILSHNELVSLWEKKVGKTFERVYVPEEVLKQIQESPVLLNVVLAISHAVFVNGDQTNFEIEPSFGVEASELYPDVKYTTVDEYLNRIL